MAATIVESPRFDTETIEHALWMVALHAGSAGKASEALASQGTKIPKQTLHRWKTQQHAGRYDEICAEASDQIAQKVAADAEAFMLRAAEVERKALDKLEAQLDADQVKDVASALRNITTAKALNNDKVASPLRGRPSIVTETRTVDLSIDRLERLGLTAPGPITDAEVVETPSLEAAQSPASR